MRYALINSHKKYKHALKIYLKKLLNSLYLTLKKKY